MSTPSRPTTLIAHAALVVVAAGALFFAACNSDDDDASTPPPNTPTEQPAEDPTEEPTNTPEPKTPEPQPTQPPTPLPDKSGYPDGTRTGQDRIDAILNAIERGDRDAIKQLVKYRSVDCVAPYEGAGGPPICPEGVAEGTPVEVFLAAQCEGYWIFEEEISGMVNNLAEAERRLFAVYAEPDTSMNWHDTVIVYRTMETGWAMMLGIEDGHIVDISYSCGLSPEEELARLPGGTVYTLPAAG